MAADHSNILVFDAAGTEIGRLPQSKARRFSMAAAANQKALDAFARANPGAASAKIGPYNFVIANGRSMVLPA